MKTANETVAVLGSLIVHEARVFQAHGETANRDYYTRVEAGAYPIELKRDQYCRLYVTCRLPGRVEYVGPQGGQTYEGHHTWQPRDYELAGMFAGEPAPKGCEVEPAPGVTAVVVSTYQDYYGNPKSLHHLAIAGETVEGCR